MNILETGDNYSVEKDGDEILLNYHSKNGKAHITFNGVKYGSTGFQLRHNGVTIGELYEEWGQEDGGWYFVPATQYEKENLDVEIRLPKEAVYAAIEAVRSNKISQDAMKEFQMAKEEN